jgi:hypothetical protein
MSNNYVAHFAALIAGEGYPNAAAVNRNAVVD